MKIRILQFKRPNTLEKYFCVCREICLIASDAKSYNLPMQNIKNMLLIYLKDKDYIRLQKMGWILSDNSITPPIFAEQELVEYARDFLKEKITNYRIVEINVKIELGD